MGEFEDEIEELLINAENKESLEALKDFPAMSEEDYVDMVSEAMQPQDGYKEAVKAMLRAKYAVFLSMYILEAVGVLLNIKKKDLKAIKLDALENAGNMIERLYKVKLRRI